MVRTKREIYLPQTEKNKHLIDRSLSDAKLIKEGAEYYSNGVLGITDSQFEEIKEEMDKNLKSTQYMYKEKPSRRKLIGKSKPLEKYWTFVTDRNLHKEMIDYFNKRFPYLTKTGLVKISFENNATQSEGRTHYFTTAVDMFLKSINSEYRIATHQELENLVGSTRPYTGKGYFEAKFLSLDFFIDTGLVLRGPEYKENFKESDLLFNQLRKRGLTKGHFPIFLNLKGLELDKDLRFNLTYESTYFTDINCFNWCPSTPPHSSYEWGFLKTEKFGFPEEKKRFLGL